MTYFPEKPYNIAVIGAASGIGKAAAQFLAGEGVRVFCIDRDSDGARATALAIGSLASGHSFDVTDPEGAGKVTDEIIEKAGQLHGLVNCAGIRQISLGIR